MKKSGKSIVFYLLVFVMLSGLTIFPGYADEESEINLNKVNFTAQAVLPENQIQNNASGSNPKLYFDLKMEPEQEQLLELIVTNKSEEEITVGVSTLTASTNGNGIIAYPEDGLYDESLVYKFSDIAKAEEDEVKIPKLESKSVFVRVKMPKDRYDGVLMGGISVLQKPLDSEMNLESEMGIVKQLRYIIGVRLAENLDLKFEPEFEIGDIESAIVDYYPAIVVPIKNTQALIARQIRAEVKVYPAGSGEVYAERVMDDAEMAPNSILPFPLKDETGERFRAGDYRAEVKLELEGQTYEFAKDFVLTQEKVDEVNTSIANIYNPVIPASAQEQEGGSNIILIVVISAVASIIIILSVLLILRKKKIKKI
ncbi:MAG: DUF916 and DUF3324 domain-containing protein [Oscillospiraceae bacterium]|jgi:hypothetical protein|nr:DUF916 and DUF3324 domain-containing protein [Oscillospiraceae bacterium]